MQQNLKSPVLKQELMELMELMEWNKKPSLFKHFRCDILLYVTFPKGARDYQTKPY